MPAWMRSPAIRDGRLNSPAVMAARLVFLLHLLGWMAGAFLLVAACGENSWPRVAQAGICFTLSLTGRAWLRRSHRLKECTESFDTLFSGPDLGGASGSPGPADEQLAALVERREWLEGHRGAPGFDPWELQQVRHDITDHMKKYPDPHRGLDEERSRR